MNQSSLKLTQNSTSYIHSRVPNLTLIGEGSGILGSGYKSPETHKFGQNCSYSAFLPQTDICHGKIDHRFILAYHMWP